MKKNATILVVDDEYGVQQSFNMVLKDSYNVLFAGTAEEAFDVFGKNTVDLVLLDILLPDINGIELLEKLKQMDPTSEIIMVTAVKDIQTAVKAIKLGAYEYIVKPFAVEDVQTVVDRALEKRGLQNEVTYLREELKRQRSFEKMVGESRKMKEIYELISAVSDTEGTVLIQGESGTGKELVARAIHNRSRRKELPFVVVNCGAIPPNLMESELFGYNRGAFTGATSTTVGKLEIANNGTIFLDDIDALDVNMQAKLLRVIQEKEFERLGSSKVVKIDARFVAATNRNLEKLTSEGAFREDLYYRLNVFPINLPPLRERREDIPLLVDHFLEAYSKKTGKPPKRLSAEAMEILMGYSWPGNVRELENLVERWSTMIKSPVIRSQDVSLPTNTGGTRKIKDMPLREALEAFEREYIKETLESVDGSKKKAAEILGIHRNSLLRKLK